MLINNAIKNEVEHFTILIEKGISERQIPQTSYLTPVYSHPQH
jgi:hypothetical protein